MKHTPGPWSQWGLLSGSENDRGIGIGLPTKMTVAIVMPLESDTTPEARANAHLIVAAPAMLETLETIVANELTDETPLMTLDEIVNAGFTDSHIWRKVRDTIRAAKGQQ